MNTDDQAYWCSNPAHRQSGWTKEWPTNRVDCITCALAEVVKIGDIFDTGIEAGASPNLWTVDHSWLFVKLFIQLYVFTKIGTL